jgi:hypothetical protein
MKKAVFVVLLLCVSMAFGQQYNPIPGTLLKSFTTFTSSSSMAATAITVPVTNILSGAKEVGIITVATDSVSVELAFVGSNSLVAAVSDSYADTLTGTSNTSNTRVTMLKDDTVNRLEGCDKFTLALDFLASGNGTTAGRTCKFYLFWVPK